MSGGAEDFREFGRPRTGEVDSLPIGQFEGQAATRVIRRYDPGLTDRDLEPDPGRDPQRAVHDLGVAGSVPDHDRERDPEQRECPPDELERQPRNRLGEHDAPAESAPARAGREQGRGERQQAAVPDPDA